MTFGFQPELAEDIGRVVAELRKAPGRMIRGMNKGLYRTGQRVYARSQELVPVGGPPTSPNDPHPGELKASGLIVIDEPADEVATVTVSYGGQGSISDAYARVQHEDLTYRHKDGQQAKYLERAVLESGNDLRTNTVAGMREELG